MGENRRRPPDPMLFESVHGIFGTSRAKAEAGFNFDEDQGIPVQRHEVDLSAGGAKIPLHNPVAVAAQAARREPLTLIAERTSTAAEIALQKARNPPKPRHQAPKAGAGQLINVRGTRTGDPAACTLRNHGDPKVDILAPGKQGAARRPWARLMFGIAGPLHCLTERLLKA
jgi:hypothetical protein